MRVQPPCSECGFQGTKNAIRLGAMVVLFHHRTGRARLGQFAPEQRGQKAPNAIGFNANDRQQQIPRDMRDLLALLCRGVFRRIRVMRQVAQPMQEVIAFLIRVTRRQHGRIPAAWPAIGRVPITTTRDQPPTKQAEFRPPAGFAIFRFISIANECRGIEPRRFRRQDLEGLIEIARSPSVPGLPLITRAGDPVGLREGLARAFADPALVEAREALLMSGYSVLEASAYGRITALEAEMERAGGVALL